MAIEFVDYNGKDVNNILNYYPIGSIFITTTNTNPGTFLGGTWEAFGTGRTLVGVDSSQTEFNTVLKTGGNKNMQQHNHGITNFTVARFDYVSKGGTYIGPTQMFFVVGNKLPNTDAGEDNDPRTWFYSMEEDGSKFEIIDSGSGDSGNLQPYITVYMWKRTA